MQDAVCSSDMYSDSSSSICDIYAAARPIHASCNGPAQAAAEGAVMFSIAVSVSVAVTSVRYP